MIVHAWLPEPRLADAIERARATIVAEEVARLGRGTPHYREQAREVLAAWAADAVDVVVSALRNGDDNGFPRYTGRMRRVRLSLGFTVGEVVAALLGFRDTLHASVRQADDAGEWRRAIDVVTQQLVASVAGAFGEAILLDATAATSSLHERHERLAILEERQRLGRDLHDSVSQSLYGVIMYAAAASRLLAAGQVAPAARHLEELQASALDALREMRLLLFDLRPPVLDTEGLAGALRTRLASVESRSGVATTFEETLERPLSRVIEEGLYGVAQEALNNALKHARATRVSVRLGSRAGTITLEIEDNGCGFDIAAAESRGGFGLRGMRERSEFLGGVLEIATGESGTTVRLTVPPHADGEIDRAHQAGRP